MADDSFIGYEGRRLASVCNKEKLQRILAYMLDENEFLSPYGIRSLSNITLSIPSCFTSRDRSTRYNTCPPSRTPACLAATPTGAGLSGCRSMLSLFGACCNMYPFYGDDFKVECPTGSGNYMTLFEVAKEIARRLSSIFLRDANGKRPVYGGTKKFQEDPHWRDYILFYEYFHGDNGAGLGASHQNGWTGIIARTLDFFARVGPEDVLQNSTEALGRMTREQVAGK